jgi:nicotinamidase-related amidase
MLLDADDSHLILIDYQTRLMPAMHEGASALDNAIRLAQAARLLRVPSIVTEQNPSKLGETPAALRSLCDQVLSKMAFSAAEEGLLDMLAPAPAPVPKSGSARSVPAHLRKGPQEATPPRSTIVVAGIEAHVCLLQTALELIDTQEYMVYAVTDACTARTERNRDAAFDRLAGAGAELVTTEMVLFEWLQTCEHPHFKEIQALIK